ncbi:DUF4397 domain-containing protein [Sphingobacterium faecale]|uniref:DUF4397 domain-containing protein n=1 Tax=Sphingobacterium faecale TaxID=2803775 RepID=A0ABS1RA52_9SPHI|nr:DUF4397 domain-containing protein [Sphingobacterium faecale]MBL1411205.1 DUF4397 domain-containing protein [Sphingobacterium faecale]
MIRFVNSRCNILVLLGLFCLFSCKEEEKSPQQISSLTLVHAVVNAGTLKTNFKGREPIRYTTANGVNYGIWNTGSGQYTISSKNKQLGLFHVPDTLVDSKPFFLIPLEVGYSPLQTLFLTGTLQNPEYRLVNEQLPRLSPADSIVGVRFVHLAPDQPAVNIYLRGAVLQEKIGYRDNVTNNFHLLSAKKSQPEYVFEFRDATTDELLNEYRFDPSDESLDRNIYRNRCISLVLTGGPHKLTSPQFSTILVHHF